MQIERAVKYCPLQTARQLRSNLNYTKKGCQERAECQ